MRITSFLKTGLVFLALAHTPTALDFRAASAAARTFDSMRDFALQSHNLYANSGVFVKHAGVFNWMPNEYPSKDMAPNFRVCKESWQGATPHFDADALLFL